jgi:YHS domain-containing protein
MARVQDPVCGMMIEPDQAARRTTRDGETFYFCSQECERQFQSDPDRYGMEKHEPPFTVSKGGMTAPKFGSAGSGGAELEPGPERHGEDEH